MPATRRRGSLFPMESSGLLRRGPPVLRRLLLFLRAEPVSDPGHRLHLGANQSITMPGGMDSLDADWRSKQSGAKPIWRTTWPPRRFKGEPIQEDKGHRCASATNSPAITLGEATVAPVNRVPRSLNYR